MSTIITEADIAKMERHKWTREDSKDHGLHLFEWIGGPDEVCVEYNDESTYWGRYRAMNEKLPSGHVPITAREAAKILARWHHVVKCWIRKPVDEMTYKEIFEAAGATVYAFREFTHSSGGEWLCLVESGGVKGWANAEIGTCEGRMVGREAGYEGATEEERPSLILQNHLNHLMAQEECLEHVEKTMMGDFPSEMPYRWVKMAAFGYGDEVVFMVEQMGKVYGLRSEIRHLKEDVSSLEALVDHSHCNEHWVTYAWRFRRSEYDKAYPVPMLPQDDLDYLVSRNNNANRHRRSPAEVQEEYEKAKAQQ